MGSDTIFRAPFPLAIRLAVKLLDLLVREVCKRWANQSDQSSSRESRRERRIMELETTALSCRKGPWNWKPRRFPAGKDHGIGNHDAFLQERTMELET